MWQTIEQVVLVDERGTPIGTADKSVIHTGETPLHLAFSCHVFRPDGRVLLTRRALGKRTFPGVWTNSFCGHPAPGEDPADAVRRRGARELGLEIGALDLVLPEFRYEASDASGIVENEICPVYRAVVDADPQPAADEVAEWQWVEPQQVRTAVEAAPFAFSPWLALQLRDWTEFGR
ncbi:MAG TPA: isopentenyl-diphosphate Delta-isomerase [Pseudolysinimonas sp.]|nr:isopentenyl-diphosphate Delta-isomerase [Pseudolysinimonas sp.]